ncbi:xaa-Pro aminopeptidase ApepP-like [Anneissia japonica]|uniref:xaa-Pro aminopeptidase ApepP-like n=1 Tax=Anneissia japonica TaxID=1529436 RepID=UPI0014258171|nr:xaa-Pro aminopeptidase ApepP-like [Anneissia japonica]
MQAFTFYVGLCLTLGIAILDSTITVVVAQGTHHGSSVIPLDQRDCSGPNPRLTPTTIQTSLRLADLRKQMEVNRVRAYIIPSGDAHMSEYTAEHDKRREFITGFSGSAGLAVVSIYNAAIWVDGRYYLQVEQQVDCNWQVIRADDIGTLTPFQWIENELLYGYPVGFDPKTMPIQILKDAEEFFSTSPKRLRMQRLQNNLVDIIWRNQPPLPDNRLMVLEQKYAGKSWQEKIKDVRKVMQEKDANTLLISVLDEIAWLFNLRGTDVTYSPVFFSYAILTSSSIRLYLSAFNKTKDDRVFQQHLNVCLSPYEAAPCVEVKTYADFYEDVMLVGTLVRGKIWIGSSANVFIHDVITQEKKLTELSPIVLMKAVKNPIEQRGMKNAHIKDAVALIEFATWLEREVPRAKGNIRRLSEISAATKLETYRRMQDGMKGLSFPTISGFGPNGAVIHYFPTEATNVAITNKNMYLLDSGGQYLDGTTDVTRTFHFGTPTAFHKEAYTRVLMGSIDLARLTFRTGIFGRDIDVVARAPLWASGLGYKHGTGHGIGHYLHVHEGPARIKYGYRPNEAALQPGMFLSDEPGYYEPNSFGVRLETIVMVVEKPTTHKFSNWTFMGFEPITVVPFEPNLINYDMLSYDQIVWLNEYNKLIERTVLRELSPEAQKWLRLRTKQINVENTNKMNRNPFNSATSTNLGMLTLVAVFLFSSIVL